jgi:hypothetical protein
VDSYGSRVSFVLPDGQKACLRCVERKLETGYGVIRPARKDRSRQQSYCRECQTEYQRAWRRDRTAMLGRSHDPLLTLEELELLADFRRARANGNIIARPAGRHHAEAQS